MQPRRHSYWCRNCSGLDEDVTQPDPHPTKVEFAVRTGTRPGGILSDGELAFRLGSITITRPVGRVGIVPSMR